MDAATIRTEPKPTNEMAYNLYATWEELKTALTIKSPMAINSIKTSVLNFE